MKEFTQRKSINRGYRKLTVWQDAVGYYALTCEIFQGFPFVLQSVASQQVASVDSIHRNIAKGYCRRSIKEYLQFLNIAFSSAGESVSGLHVYRHAGQFSEADFERLDAAAWKLENGLRRLIESLQYKKDEGEWDDSFVVKESNAEYQTVETTNAQQNGTDARDGCLEETKYASDAQRLNRSKRK